MILINGHVLLFKPRLPFKSGIMRQGHCSPLCALFAKFRVYFLYLQVVLSTKLHLCMFDCISRLANADYYSFCKYCQQKDPFLLFTGKILLL